MVEINYEKLGKEMEGMFGSEVYLVTSDMYGAIIEFTKIKNFKPEYMGENKGLTFSFPTGISLNGVHSVNILNSEFKPIMYFRPFESAPATTSSMTLSDALEKYEELYILEPREVEALKGVEEGLNNLLHSVRELVQTLVSAECLEG